MASPDAPDQLAGGVFHGFGSTIGTWTTRPSLAPMLDRYMREWVETVEAACSRFRPESDLSRANAESGSTVTVAKELVAATIAARSMAALTDGLCDPTIGEAVVAAGYDRTFEAVAAEGPGPLRPARPGGAWEALEADAETSTIRVPRGYQLDLGGSAKGWAVDMALEGLRRTVLADLPDAGVCISAGGDLAVTGVGPVGGWPVTIAERLAPSALGAFEDVRLRRGALATSGIATRRWQHGDDPGHHIIDPRTGRPSDSRWALVSVLSDSCLVADTTAKAALLLDADGPAWLEALGLAGRFMDRDGAVTWAGDPTAWISER